MLTRNDLAKKFGVHVATIDRWRVVGILPAPLMLGVRTIRWRETDVALFDQWLLDQVRAQAEGLDPTQIPKPDYSLPLANDPSSLTRELLASRHDAPSELLSESDELQRKLDQLCANAAILASKSKPDQVSDASVEHLRKHLSDEVRERLMQELPPRNAARLEEILSV